MSDSSGVRLRAVRLPVEPVGIDREQLGQVAEEEIDDGFLFTDDEGGPLSSDESPFVSTGTDPVTDVRRTVPKRPSEASDDNITTVEISEDIIAEPITEMRRRPNTQFGRKSRKEKVFEYEGAYAVKVRCRESAPHAASAEPLWNWISHEAETATSTWHFRKLLPRNAAERERDSWIARGWEARLVVVWRKKRDRVAEAKSAENRTPRALPKPLRRVG